MASPTNTPSAQLTWFGAMSAPLSGTFSKPSSFTRYISLEISTHDRPRGVEGREADQHRDERQQGDADQQENRLILNPSTLRIKKKMPVASSVPEKVNKFVAAKIEPRVFSGEWCCK